MKKLENLLLVSGSGRNCGKTTFACHVIHHMAKFRKVIGLKISPHFHFTGNKQILVAQAGAFKIYEESDFLSGKDSSRMLQAGAFKVYYVQCTDAGLPGIWKAVEKLLPENTLVVCESGSFSKTYTPGAHVLVADKIADESKTSFLWNLKKADFIIHKEDFSTDYLGFDIQFTDKNWQIKKLQDDKVRRSA